MRRYLPSFRKATWIILFSLSAAVATAQPGGGPPSDPGPPVDPAAIPVDGGVGLLAAAGVALGARYFRKGKARPEA